jgi:hypothetical protein
LTAPRDYPHPNRRSPQNATQLAAIKRKSNCRGDVFLNTPRALNAFFVLKESAVCRDGAVHFVSRTVDDLNVGLRFAVRPLSMQRSKFFILGRDSLGRKRACQVRIPSCSADFEMLDCTTNRRVANGRYLGHPFAGEFALPLHRFSPLHDLFIKVDRRSWFFDEAGWIEIPAVPNLTNVSRVHDFSLRQKLSFA